MDTIIKIGKKLMEDYFALGGKTTTNDESTGDPDEVIEWYITDYEEQIDKIYEAIIHLRQTNHPSYYQVLTTLIFYATDAIEIDVNFGATFIDLIEEQQDRRKLINQHGDMAITLEELDEIDEAMTIPMNEVINKDSIQDLAHTQGLIDDEEITIRENRKETEASQRKLLDYINSAKDVREFDYRLRINKDLELLKIMIVETLDQVLFNNEGMLFLCYIEKPEKLNLIERYLKNEDVNYLYEKGLAYALKDHPDRVERFFRQYYCDYLKQGHDMTESLAEIMHYIANNFDNKEFDYFLYYVLRIMYCNLKKLTCFSDKEYYLKIIEKIEEKNYQFEDFKNDFSTNNYLSAMFKLYLEVSYAYLELNELGSEKQQIIEEKGLVLIPSEEYMRKFYRSYMKD